MLETIIFICSLIIIVPVFLFIMAYVNLRRKLGGMDSVNSNEALRQFIEEIRNRDARSSRSNVGTTKPKRKSKNTDISKKENNVEDAEFFEKTTQ